MGIDDAGSPPVPAAGERVRAREDVRALARPRLTGSTGAQQVEQTLRSAFEGLGYYVDACAFEFSDWPGRYGLALGGAVQSATLLLAAALVVGGRARAGAAVALAGLALLAAIARLAPGATRWLPWGRRRGVNWIVRRPDAAPRWLVAAHRDSKSQGFATLPRTVAIVVALAAAVLVSLDSLLAAIVRHGPWPTLALAVGVPGAAAGALLATVRVGNDSPGALDNATGLAALLGLARRCHGHDDVAFLVTDAEELGLAGARAIVSALPADVGIINLDGLDDGGAVQLIEGVGRLRRRGRAPVLTAALRASADALGEPLVRRTLPFGVLLDHLPWAAAGRPALTLMRGTPASLRRIHRPTDEPGALDGQGVARTVALVDGALRRIRAHAAAPLPPC